MANIFGVLNLIHWPWMLIWLNRCGMGCKIIYSALNFHDLVHCFIWVSQGPLWVSCTLSTPKAGVCPWAGKACCHIKTSSWLFLLPNMRWFFPTCGISSDKTAQSELFILNKKWKLLKHEVTEHLNSGSGQLYQKRPYGIMEKRTQCHFW